MTWLLRTFGGISLESARGEPLPGVAEQRARLALLAVIANAGDAGIDRDRLLALFWPDYHTDRARGALKQAIYVLRRDLGDPGIIVGNGALHTDRSRVDVDVTRFEEELKAGNPLRAIAWYRGPFLAGTHVASSEFEHWRDREERRLQALYLQALNDLASAARARDDHADAVLWRRKALEVDPLSDRATAALMRALVAAGDSSGALMQARHYAQLVREQLDSAPSHLVLELEAEIRGSLRVTSAPVASPEIEPPTAPTTPAAVASPPSAATFGMHHSPAEPMEPRRWLPSGRALLVGALALAGLAVPLVRVAPNTIHIRIDDRSHVLPDAGSTQRSIFRAVVARLPGVSQASWWRGRAEHTAVITVGTVGDSVVFVIPAASQSVIARSRTSDDARAIGAMADAVAIQVAAQRNPLLSRWYASTSGMRTWDAYEALAQGLARWHPFGPQSNPEVFDRAATIDPNAGTPLVLKALGQAKSLRTNDARETIASITREQRRLGPWEGAVLSVLDSWLRNDLATAHRRGHELEALVPGSEWAIVVAYDALGVGRAHESLEIMDRIPAGVPWLQHWRRVNRHQALLMLRDYTAALEDAQELLRDAPEDRFAQQSAAKALAGLGRTAEVEALCRRSLSLRFDWQPCSQAIMELRYHGHLTSARTLAEAFVAALSASDSVSSAELMVDRAGALMDAGAWEEARRELARIPGTHRSRTYAWHVAASAAERGDRATMDSAVRFLGLGPGESPMERANLAALIGDSSLAVELLASSYRRGGRRGFSLAPWGGLDRLRGYPPFDSLVAPRRDAHERSVAIAGARRAGPFPAGGAR